MKSTLRSEKNEARYHFPAISPFPPFSCQVTESIVGIFFEEPSPPPSPLHEGLKPDDDEDGSIFELSTPIPLQEFPPSSSQTTSPTSVKKIPNGAKLRVKTPLEKNNAKDKRAKQSSSFCHFCARTRRRKLFRCSRKFCKKCVCEDCCFYFGWDIKATDTSWECPHCLNLCGNLRGARCIIYRKANKKRHKKSQQIEPLRSGLVKHKIGACQGSQLVCTQPSIKPN